MRDHDRALLVVEADEKDGMQKRWNIVTVAFNSAGDLRDHWANTIRGEDAVWTVVDNASQDESREVAATLGAEVVALPDNVGFGAANNIGAAHVESRYVLFVNPDITMVPSDLPRIADLLDANPRSIVSPQLMNPDGTPQASGRGFPTIGAKIMNRLRKNASTRYQLFAPFGSSILVSWTMGAAVAMTREFFDQIKWDPRFFVYYEDADIGLRVWAAGGKVILAGGVHWTHSWARATTKINWKAWRLEINSMVKFYSRYPHLTLPETIARRWFSYRSLLGTSISSSGSTASDVLEGV